METLQAFATLVFILSILLCGGTILRYAVGYPWRASRVEEIRRLRQEGLAVNQDDQV